MRNVILNLAVSLDGFIEGPAGEIDWCLTDQDYGMSDFMKKVDTIFMGRKSYELMNSLSANNPFAHLKTFVFSNTITSAGPNIQIVKGSIEKEAAAIKRQPGNDIWLFGGAQLITAFLNAGLVDQLLLAVHPIVLGNGKRLFQGIQTRVPLKLVGSTEYSSGLIQLLYRVERKSAKKRTPRRR